MSNTADRMLAMLRAHKGEPIEFIEHAEALGLGSNGGRNLRNLIKSGIHRARARLAPHEEVVSVCSVGKHDFPGIYVLRDFIVRHRQ